MKEFKDGKRPLRGAFPKTTIIDKSGTRNVADLSERRASTQFFAVVSNGGTTDHFRVLTPYGRSYGIKYAHLPHVVLEGHELMILIHDLQVLLRGRNLSIIENHILNHELLWVKQSPSGKDDGEAQVFINEIQVKGSVHKLIGELKNDEE